MRPLRLDGVSDALIIAPHPDDESLASGGLIQRAVAAGARVRVLFLPHGEKKLGVVGDDKMIVVYRPNQPGAPAYDAIAVAKDDPLALRAAQQSDQA